MGRAFRLGKEPTIPALHWAMTKSGLEIMNKGAATTGMRSLPTMIFGIAISKVLEFSE